MKSLNKIKWEDLKDLYLNKHMSSFKIAELKGCVKSTVLIELKKQGIVRRHGRDAVSEETKLRFSKERKGINNPFYGKKHSDILKNKWSKERSGKNHPNFGKELSEEHKLKIKNTCLERGISKGEKNPNFQNWKSKEPYTKEWNNDFRDLIRMRDNHVCMLCNKPEEELSEKLHVHHIDYNKKNVVSPNCICLCRKCHLLTNYRRSYWTEFFHSILKEEYSFEYSENGDIIINLKGGIYEIV